MKIFLKNILFHIYSFALLVSVLVFFEFYSSTNSIERCSDPQDSDIYFYKTGHPQEDSKRSDESQLSSNNYSSIFPVPLEEDKSFNLFQDTLKPNHCLSGHEADVWYLGKNGIKWINDTPTVITGFADYVGEVMSSICDKNGDLLLYSNGDFIFNKYHERLATIILKGGGSSSTFLILPQPGNDSIYYVFQPQATYGNINDTIFNLYYTVVNVKANNYHGKVLQLSQLLMNTSSEKVTAIRHCNGRDWWIIGLRATDEAFYSWILSDTGLTVNNPIVSYSGSVNHLLTYDQKNLGWLKPSHDGRYIVEVTAGGQLYSALELHRFNNTTGMIYDGIQVLDQADKFIYLYSIEWSPDQSKIYVTGYNSASGYDLFQLEINQFDKTKIRNSLTNIAATQSNIGSPILGADNKIYITNWGSKSEFLHVIHKPNLSGINCDFRYFDFSLGSKTSLGAPLYASGLQFPYRAYIQGEQFICHDTTVRYILTDPCSHPETQWSVFDGAKIIRHNEDTIDVYFGSSGTYRISATYPTECGFKSDTIEGEVQECDKPKPDHCLSGHEADVWYLGKNGIKWINDTPTVITGFADDVYEVQSSICDRSGDLLLYSDGNYIYNKFHERIANIRNYSGSSSSMFLILPQPGNDSIYYVFHPQETTGSVNDSLFDLFFTVIDIRANLGHCKVLNLGQLLLKTSSEKVTGVRHCNGRDWWIIGLRATDEAFHSWILSDTGINVSNPIISYSGNINHLAFYDQENLGWLKPSHDGKFLIEVTSGSQLYSTLEIHKFNSTSGIITDGLQVLGQVDKFEELYSIEWSPNQQIIYVTGFNKSGGYDLFQMNVSKYDQYFIRSSLINLASTPSNIGSPVLGKDQKIYLTNYGTNLGNLHIIRKPNRLGMDCELELFNFDVMNELDLGAPLFASGLQFPYRVYIQGEQLVCQDTMVRYILTDPCSHPETQWSVFDGAKIMRQAEDTIDVYFGKSGNYRISATYPTECGFKTDTIEIEVEKCKCNNEISWSTIDTLVCQGSDASFKFSTTSKEVYLDNQKVNTDSFTLPNLQSDTCINLRLVYPRFCDSIIQICIRVLPVAVDSVIFNLCPNDSVFIYDTWYSKDTSFTLHYISKLICDSLVTYKVDAHSFDTSLVILDYCIGDTAIINNQKFWFTDTLHQLFQSTSGCLDSFQQLIISFNSNIKRTSQSYQRCFGDSIFILDHWYSGDTVLIDTLMSSSMCDSISTITIDILPAIAPIIINYSRCQGDTLLLTTSQGFLSITYSRMFKDTWTSFQGCDSVVLHQVSFYPNSSSSLLLSKCKGDSIFYKDKYYINPLKLVDSFSTVYGCDSLVSIEIVDYPVSSSSLVEMSSCLGDSILFQSNWFKKDTTIELLLTDQNGCDSIHQVSLSFRSLPDTTNLSLKVCKGDSIFYNGTYYYDSARIIRVFPSSNNCDSIVYVSIDLLSAPISSIDTFSICPGDSIYIDNRYYYDSVILSKKFQAVNGCDSFHTSIISLFASPETVIKHINFCKGDSVLVNSLWYKNPEELQFRFPSAQSCDSSILIKLQWHPTVDINLTTQLDLKLGSIVVLDAGIIQSGISYRWYPSDNLSCNDCSSPILTASKDTVYYLEIIDQNGCLTLDSIIIRIIKSTNNDIYLPTIFSPNDDNINDIWIPIVGSSDIDIYQISIYDRWGAMVFSTTTLAGWNGKIGSQPAIPGVYAYFISWQDGQGVRHNTRGDITLVR